MSNMPSNPSRSSIRISEISRAHGDFRNGDRQHKLAELRMHRPGHGTGLVNVQKVDAVERQNSARHTGPHFEGLDHVLDNGAIPIRKVFELAVKSSDLQ
ncbi:MAG: hypothetical protein R8G60_06410 [Roseovarius pacificus]|nr:hypothetical protein [Roseovarius pacificus]